MSNKGKRVERRIEQRKTEKLKEQHNHEVNAAKKNVRKRPDKY